MTKQKSTRESLAFESWVFIFASSNFSLEQKVHHHNFEFVDDTRDVKLPMLMMKIDLDPCNTFLSSSFSTETVLGDIARRIRTSSAMLGQSIENSLNKSIPNLLVMFFWYTVLGIHPQCIIYYLLLYFVIETILNLC